MNAQWEQRRARTAAWKADQLRPLSPELLAEKAAWVRKRTFSPESAVAFARWKAKCGSTAKDRALWIAVAEYLIQEAGQ